MEKYPLHVVQSFKIGLFKFSQQIRRGLLDLVWLGH